MYMYVVSSQVVKMAVAWRDYASFSWLESGPIGYHTTTDEAIAVFSCVQHARKLKREENFGLFCTFSRMRWTLIKSIRLRAVVQKTMYMASTSIPHAKAPLNHSTRHLYHNYDYYLKDLAAYRGESVDDFHRVQGHLHIDQDGKVFCDLIGLNQT